MGYHFTPTKMAVIKMRDNSKNLWDCSSPGGSDGKESACSAGDPGWIPGGEDPLEKEMATHSSILAWRIPWTEKPSGLHKESDMTEQLTHTNVSVENLDFHMLL